MAINPRLLSVLERIVHPSTEGHDLEQSVAGLRRLLNGNPIEQMITDRPSAHRSYDSFSAEISDLRRALRTAEAALHKAKGGAHVADLVAEVAALKARLTAMDAPLNGHYTRVQVAALIHRRFGKQHGVCKALCERNARLRDAGEDIEKITETILQKCRRQDRYPEWMMDQLRQLTRDDLLARHKWSEPMKAFVVALLKADPDQSNAQIARAVYDRFGRRVTDSAICGVINRAGLVRDMLR